MKVAIARALVHDPADDPARRAHQRPRHHERARAARAAARRCARAGKCLLFSSHVMQEVAALCDRIVILGARPRRRAGHGRRARRAGGHRVARGRVRHAARQRRRAGGMSGARIAGVEPAPHRASRARRSVDASRDRRTLLVTLLVRGRRRADLPRADLQPDREPGRARARAQAAGRSAASTRPRSIAFLERQQVTLSDAPADYEARSARGDLDVVLVVDEQLRARRRRRAARAPCGSCTTARATARSSSIEQAEALLRAYNRLWGAQRLILRGVHAAVGNPLNVEDVDLATPQQSGALVLFLVALLRAVRGADGRHGVRARHDRRRARARSRSSRC